MGYSKPKVTIDLEEYEYLKKCEEDITSQKNIASEDTMPYRKAISAIIGTFYRAEFPDRRALELINSAPLRENVIMRINHITGNYFDVHCEMKNLNHEQ